MWEKHEEGAPTEEAEDVICDVGYWKRTLGLMQNTRNFGNSLGKRTAAESERYVLRLSFVSLGTRRSAYENSASVRRSAYG